jgi:hypothetical protein
LNGAAAQADVEDEPELVDSAPEEASVNGSESDPDADAQADDEASYVPMSEWIEDFDRTRE